MYMCTCQVCRKQIKVMGALGNYEEQWIVCVYMCTCQGCRKQIKVMGALGNYEEQWIVCVYMCTCQGCRKQIKVMRGSRQLRRAVDSLCVYVYMSGV